MSNLVLYHSDGDGICAAAIVNKALPDCEFYAMNYGFKTPWNKIKKADQVIMVDFGLQPFSDMIKLLEMKGDNLIWIDHHVTAINDEIKSGQKFRGIREIGKAGCELTWQYFFSDVLKPSFIGVPKAVKMIGRYDVWDTNYHEDIMPFHYGMLMKNLGPQDLEWNSLLIEGDVNHLYNEIRDNGKICYAYQKMRYQEYCSRYNYVINDWEGYNWVACNSLNSNSNLFDGYFDEDKYDAMISFGLIGNGKYTVSLYTTKEGVDVGTIAKKYGGGGHRGAAGFQAEELPFPIKGTKIS